MVVSFQEVRGINGLGLLLSMGLLLAGCASDGSKDSRYDDGLGDQGSAGPSVSAAPGPEPTAFEGRPVAGLTRFLGEPALVRREGENAFLRYDLENCRVFAVVVPAGGTVTSLSTGPLSHGAMPLSFSACTAGR
ncbi:MAG: hypothetical protein AAF788_06970 [Pseudomonadota bacterium]